MSRSVSKATQAFLTAGFVSRNWLCGGRVSLRNLIAVDSKGRVFVLDMAFQRIRVFAANRKPEFMIGQKGSGPLDLRFGVAIWAEDDGVVAVSDVVLGTKYLAAESKATTRLLRTGPDGRELQRFGEGYDASTPLVRMIMSEGTVGCMRDGSTISALSKLPFVVSHGEFLSNVRYDEQPKMKPEKVVAIDAQ